MLEFKTGLHPDELASLICLPYSLLVAFSILILTSRRELLSLESTDRLLSIKSRHYGLTDCRVDGTPLGGVDVSEKCFNIPNSCTALLRHKDSPLSCCSS